MIYSLQLHTIALVLGVLLIVSHGVALGFSNEARDLLKGFPRSRPAGVVLLTIGAIWFFLLVKNMDLGEFTSWRGTMLTFIPVWAVATILFVEEFLAVRALGILLLLGAEPLIESAFLKPGILRYFVNLLAYVWAVLGLFWVGMPYLLRDQIAWVSKTGQRWKLACLGGIAYGVLLVVLALLS